MDSTSNFYIANNHLDFQIKQSQGSSADQAVSNKILNKNETFIRKIWERIKNWNSPNDVKLEKKDVRKRSCFKSLGCLVIGILPVVALGIFAAYAIKPYVKKLNPKIPDIPKSQIKFENFAEKAGRKITLITAYDAGIKDYAGYVIPNQRNYAEKQGYSYIEYFGNLAHDNDIPRAPYWSKIVALNDQLQKTEEGGWVAWADASVLFTNSKKNFDQVIDQYGKDKDIIVTTDPQVPINNAIFLLKNTPWTKNWIKKVWKRADLARGGEGNCWSWGQPFCHYEQQAMTELWESSPEVQKHTALIPNKVMNSFYRYSHYDQYRRMYQDYDGDLESSKWSSGDFVCKVTGMDKDRRLSMIKHVAQNCIDKPCELKNFG